MRKTDIDTSDISIYGQGFYQITADTRRGERFLLRVQGGERGTTYSDDTRLTQAIADGACSKGLRVDVNGQIYKGR